MSGKTYVGTYGSDITLANFASANPVTLAGTFGGTQVNLAGVVGTQFPWTVINTGIVSHPYENGISLGAGGEVINVRGAVIRSPGNGVVISGGPGTVLNYGYLSTGVAINAGTLTGTLVNEPSGTLVQMFGVRLSTPGSSFVNEGTLRPSYAVGSLYLYSGVSAINAVGGAISGVVGSVPSPTNEDVSFVNNGLVTGGITLEAGGTINDSGSIVGSLPIDFNGPIFRSIAFNGSISNLLILQPGAALRPTTGVVAALGSTTASNTVELAVGSASLGTFDGFAPNTTFVNFGSFSVDAGADWLVDSNMTLLSGATLSDNGTLTVEGSTDISGTTLAVGGNATLSLDGFSTISNSATFANSGTVVVDGTMLLSGLLTGNGTIATQAGAHNRIVETFYGGLIKSNGIDTITAGSVTVNVLAQGSGSLFFSGGTGSSTVAGGSGVSTLFGGTGTVLFAAASGGSSLLVAGSGNSTLIAGGPNDQLFAGAGNTTSFGAAAGAAFLIGGSGISVLVGSGAATDFIGGAGQTFIYGGAGNDTVYTGTGQTYATLGGGADTMLIQTGSGSFLNGAGADFYAMVNGAAGGSVTISGFKVGIDQIGLFGYGANPIAANQIVGGSTVLTFADGTHITLAGVANPGNAVV